MNTIFARCLTTILEPRLFLKKLSFGSTLPHWLRSLGSILISGLTLAILFCLLLTSPTPAYADDPIFTDSGQRLGNADTMDVGLGDLDNDGDLDAFAVNRNVGDGDEPNKVWLNNGSGNFSDSGQSLGNSDSSSIALGDLDGDGDLDAFVANGDVIIAQGNTVWLNDGTGSFSDSGQSLGDSASWDVALGDLDGDGDLDSFVANIEDKRVWLNDGAGRFTDSNHYFDSSSRSFIALGDLDEDGDLDAFVGELDGQNRILLNDGTGHFSVVQSWDDSSAADVALKDLDRDGDLDVFVGNYGDGGNSVYLNNGAGHFIDSGQSLGNSDSDAVALEDLEKDGDVDVVIGNLGHNKVWLNDGAGNFPDDEVESLESSMTMSNAVALGDLDGDGDIDALIGNLGANEIWLKRSHFFDSGQSLDDLIDGADECDETIDECEDQANSHDVALGDLDNDGDLDVLVATYRGPNKVWLNDGDGRFQGNGQDWPTGNSYAAPLGDLDGDGDLDAFVANSAQPNRIWLNDGNGVFTLNQSLGHSTSTDVALGDLDGDGDLDAFVVNLDGDLHEPNKVWLNNGSGNFSQTDQNLGNSYSLSVALGDLDGDGDLDAFVGNVDGNKIWLNNGTAHFTSTNQDMADSFGSNISLGDLDSDGDLDAFVPNGSVEPSKVWLNDGTGNFKDSLQALGNAYSNGAALEDLDGDGDLDAFVANDNYNYESNTIWLNNGTAEFTKNSQSLGNSDSRGVAVGDLDGDGNLDAFVANGGANKVYLAKIGGTTRPQISVQKPGPTQDADFYSTPAILDNQMISITYTLFDPNSTPIGQVKAFYSMDGGDNWQPALATDETTTTNLATSPSGVSHLLTWDTFKSGFFGQSDNVVLRIVAYPQPKPTGIVGSYQYANRVPGPYIWPYAASTTFPFRVRGTQVRVYSDTIGSGNELADALVYRLPAGQSDASPLVSSANQPLTSDQNGYLIGRGQLALGDQLMAMLSITTTNSYTFYHTSAAPTETGLEMASVSEPRVQELVVSADNALLVFDLDVSLEWDARNEAAFLNQLESDLERTSEILYDLTNGQVALGEIRVHQAKENWNYSHIVVHASNTLRPSAALGGIVREPVSETLSNTEVITDAYLPGQIHMSALWNRFGNPAGGDAVEDWPRTLAHELGHYLLFIPDNYLGLSDNGMLSQVECLGSVMTDAYREDYSEFLTRHAWENDEDCLSTLAQYTTGRPDWETVTTFYQMLKGDGENMGPSHLPLNVTQVRFYDPEPPVNTLLDPFFNVTYENDPLPLPFGQAQGYLFKSQNTEELTDDVVIPLGSPINDLLRTRGAEPGDRLCLFDYGHSPRRVGCQQISQESQSLALHDVSEWEPQIIVKAITSVTLGITVTQEMAPNEELNVQLLPAIHPMTTTVAIAPVAHMNRVDTETFTQTVTLDYPMTNGFVRLWATEGAGREEMSEFSISGGWGPNAMGGWGPNAMGGWGPNAMGGWGPNAMGGWGASNHSWQAPIRARDAQVTIFDLDHILGGNPAYALQSLSVSPNLPSWLTQVGQAYRFSAADQLSNTLNIMFEYMQREVPGDREDRLRIYYSPDSQGTGSEGERWQLLSPELDSYRNLASAKMPGAGIYTLVSTIELPLSGPAWNNFAYLAASQPVTTTLASIGDAYTSVAHYDGASQAWRFYDRTIAPEFAWVNDLRYFEFEQAYWLHATEAITLYVGTAELNDLSSPSSGLQLPPATFYGTVSATDAFTPTVGMAITAYIEGNLCGQSTIEARDNQLVYKLQVMAENVFGEPNGCGAKGKQIVFQVGDWRIEGEREWDNSQASYHPLPTENSFTIDLVPGWNLISLPIQPTASAIEQVLLSIAGNYTIVYAYDGCDTSDPWKSYDPSAPRFVNDLREIKVGIGLWINMTTSDTLELTGTQLASPSIPLCSDWNLVGYPFQQTKPLTDALAPLEGSYTIVHGYQASAPSAPWQKHDPTAPPFANDLTEMQPGFGYWIQMTQEIDWPFE